MIALVLQLGLEYNIFAQTISAANKLFSDTEGQLVAYETTINANQVDSDLALVLKTYNSAKGKIFFWWHKQR